MRALDTATLDAAAVDYARMWLSRDIKTPSGKLYADGPSRVLQDFYNFTYKDEFDYLLTAFRDNLGSKANADFEAKSKGRFTERDPKVLEQLLKEKLALTPGGNLIEGHIGKVQVGVRPIRKQLFTVETLGSIRRRKQLGLPIHVEGRTDRETVQRVGLLKWPVYAGEAEARIIAEKTGQFIGDELPEDAFATLPDGRLAAALNAANPNISAESAIAALNAIVDSLDEGTTAATIRGRTGTQPADPDAAESGTLLFTLTMSDPAFGAAADDTPSALATADTITDDASADATNTLAYCRAGATGTGADDHIDGSAGTADADFIFNTLSIVSGAVISMSSFTVAFLQGSTAT